MANSTRYFQLTPYIMLEFQYVGNTIKDEGDVQDLIIDLTNKNRMYMTNDSYNGSKYLFCRDADNDNKANNNYNNLVLPINSNDSKFVQVYNQNTNQYYNSLKSTELETTEISFPDSNTCDVYFDTCIIHFTSNEYMGSYDSIIFQASINDLNGSKINLASIIHKRTDSVELNDKPILINEKLYTTHFSFRIPSVDFIMNNPYGKRGLLKAITSNFNRLESNTNIEFNVLGVNATYENAHYTFYNTEQLNSIQIPFYDSYNKVGISIGEALDGDYFKISTNVGNKGTTTMSFSDYIRSIDDHPEAFVVMYEINLWEEFADDDNIPIRRKTHTEYYLVNVGFSNGDESMDDSIIYRPVCIYANKDLQFTIEVIMKIINTEDNTTIIKKNSYSSTNHAKYGKKMNRIFYSENPVQINVYNKRTDEDLDYVKISNSGGTKANIENHQYNITALVECSNIGVSIQQVSQNDIE